MMIRFRKFIRELEEAGRRIDPEFALEPLRDLRGFWSGIVRARRRSYIVSVNRNGLLGNPRVRVRSDSGLVLADLERGGSPMSMWTVAAVPWSRLHMRAPLDELVLQMERVHPRRVPWRWQDGPRGPRS